MRVPEKLSYAIGILFWLSWGQLGFSAQTEDAPTKAGGGVDTERPLSLAEFLTELPPVPPRFPLAVSDNSRYLIDAGGRPFLIIGDAAWSLIAQLPREDAEIYLRDRQARGFNTILVNLVERKFARNAPANAYGEQPFREDGRFDTPNAAYFEHADWIIGRAAELGMLVLLAPSYSGASAPEGWYREMAANGAEKMRAYGRYLGKRYEHFYNIVWVLNGDLNPPEPGLVRALAEGIRETDPKALQTAHNANGTAGADLWQDETWLQINNVYTWGPIVPAARSQYGKSPPLPYILIESQYENGPDVTTQRLRRQAYQALLSGAAGQVFGNSPLWYFDATAEYPVPAGWRAALDSPGSRSMGQLSNLFKYLPWQQIVPDLNNEFLTSSTAERAQCCIGAISSDGTKAIVYFAEDRAATLNTLKLAGSQIQAAWWDPVSGATYAAKGSPFQSDKASVFRPAAKNAGGDEDFVLILKAEN